MRLWLRSLQYAFSGFKYAFQHERNMRIHTGIAAIVFALLLMLDISTTQVMFVLLAMFLVVVSELINTAIEKTIDLTKPDRHPLAKAAKDCAAAAVLLSAIFALIIGLIVFGPFVLEGPTWRWKSIV